jgi:hypothetical protein
MTGVCADADVATQRRRQLVERRMDFMGWVRVGESWREFFRAVP